MACSNLAFLSLSIFDTDCSSLKYLNLNSFNLNFALNNYALFGNLYTNVFYCIHNNDIYNYLFEPGKISFISFCSDECFIINDTYNDINHEKCTEVILNK